MAGMKNVIPHPFGGKRTPEQVLIDALSECESYEQVVVVAVDKEGAIRTGWSQGSNLEFIGMLTFATERMCQRAAYDPDDPNNDK
jgi:hypothetical protein